MSEPVEHSYLEKRNKFPAWISLYLPATVTLAKNLFISFQQKHNITLKREK